MKTNDPKIERPEQAEGACKNHEKTTEEEFNWYLPEMCATADKVVKTETYNADIPEITEAPSIHSACHQAATPFGKTYSTITYGSDGHLVHISPIDGASQ